MREWREQTCLFFNRHLVKPDYHVDQLGMQVMTMTEVSMAKCFEWPLLALLRAPGRL